MAEPKQNADETDRAGDGGGLPVGVRIDRKSGIFTRKALENPPIADWDEPAQPMVVTRPIDDQAMTKAGASGSNQEDDARANADAPEQVSAHETLGASKTSNTNGADSSAATESVLATADGATDTGKKLAPLPVRSAAADPPGATKKPEVAPETNTEPAEATDAVEEETFARPKRMRLRDLR